MNHVSCVTWSVFVSDLMYLVLTVLLLLSNRKSKKITAQPPCSYFTFWKELCCPCCSCWHCSAVCLYPQHQVIDIWRKVAKGIPGKFRTHDSLSWVLKFISHLILPWSLCESCSKREFFSASVVLKLSLNFFPCSFLSSLS